MVGGWRMEDVENQNKTGEEGNKTRSAKPFEVLKQLKLKLPGGMGRSELMSLHRRPRLVV